jgi:hypothetical protein
MMKKRTAGVTILAFLTLLAALIAAIHALQYLHFFPFLLGPLAFFSFNLTGAILWGLSALIYAWLFLSLWAVDPQVWLFLVVFSALSLVLDFLSILGASSFVAVSPSILVNATILVYCLLPGVKKSFGTV